MKKRKKTLESKNKIVAVSLFNGWDLFMTALTATSLTTKKIKYE
jgi:hypothetical protein